MLYMIQRLKNISNSLTTVHITIRKKKYKHCGLLSANVAQLEVMKLSKKCTKTYSRSASFMREGLCIYNGCLTCLTYIIIVDDHLASFLKILYCYKNHDRKNIKAVAQVYGTMSTAPGKKKSKSVTHQ
jgi:hypothetical protein